MWNENIRLRTSPAIAIIPHETAEDGQARFGVFEFLSKSFAYCSASAIEWLTHFKTWQLPQAVIRSRSNSRKSAANLEIEALVDAGFIAAEGSELAQRHDEYIKTWGLGLSTGLYHFSSVNSDFADVDEAPQRLAIKAQNVGQPQQSWTVSGTRHDLPDPSVSESHHLLSLMASRRSNRTSRAHALRRNELSDCLFAGLGIVGHVETPTGQQVLSMTPSGGARNPYEAYIFIRRSADLPPGAYHYNALEHCLERLDRQPNEVELGRCLGNQTWVDDMSAVVVLVAVMERTMWKYADANAYRVICIEAGHIAQNCMLAATAHGLTVCPTAALAHEKLMTLFDVPPSLTTTPVYAFTLDKSAPYPDRIIPNTRFNLPAAMPSSARATMSAGA